MDTMIFLFLVIATALQNIFAQDFSYNGNTGPNEWSNKHSSCKGKHQSPIDIDMLHVKKVKLPSLKLKNFDKPPNGTMIENNGHTVYFTIETHDDVPTIDGGPFRKPYEFSQLHFHWGDNDSYGSEDAFNGKHFPMELHVVFFKKEYGSMKDAMLHSDGITVMAFFFKIANPNPAYEELSQLLGTITKPHTKATFDQPIALRDLMLPKLNEYYVYNGSLTTPPCLEVVTWLDFYDPIEISHEQLEKFRLLEDTEGNALSHNFRPVQPIGDRIVWFSSKKFAHDDDDLHDKIHGKKKKSKNSAESIESELLTISFIIGFSLRYFFALI